LTGDPFAPARRALLIGPALIVAGAAALVIGIAGDGLAWLLCVAGGILILLGFLRTLSAGAVLLFERNRKRLLVSGTPATGTITSVEPLGEKMGHPMFRTTISVVMPDGRTEVVERRGAVEPQYAGEMVVGAQLPLRIDPAVPSALAVDWDSL
jgi:hypothetical protein